MIWPLVQKNLKNLLRAKTGSLIIILGPLLVILLAGLAFDNSNTYSVKIGIHREATSTTNMLVNQLEKTFVITEYKTQEECIAAIKNTDINACMLFSPEFSIGIPTKNQITFYVDYSRVNLVWTIMNTMTEEVGEKTLEASQDLTKVLLKTIDTSQKQITEQRKTLVQLSTQNELIAKNTRNLIAELTDINLEFDDGEYPVEELTSATTQVKQWVDNALQIGQEGVNEANTFLSVAEEFSANAALTQAQKTALEEFKADVDDLKKLKEDLATTKQLTQESFENFQEQINSLVTGITNTKNRLLEADTSREYSIRILDSIIQLLDQTLINLLAVQHAFNTIDTDINNIQITDPNAITQPIVTNIKPIVQEETYLNYLFPVLIVLIVMFTALLVTPTLILIEKHSPANFRTYMTPIKDASYIAATFITASIILFLQIIIVLAISSIFFSGQVLSNALGAIILLIIINSVFILIGMILGYLFNSEETATLAAVSIGAILLFISDVIIPIESMPKIIGTLANFNPYVISSTVLRKVLLFDIGILNVIPDILALIGYIILFSLLATGTYMIMRQYSLQQLSKKFAPVMAYVHLPKRSKR
ncbi:hypothetical protein COV18_03970 [Candidatus Woesearchaeota archaeon CG10_big_fil_rev_8_21_14_0_10_37_12]|nr:MAG: hypothetical protein COV18_03970 [Candidatus Woesearchaeota archaeon CG10_big_fil_rev_8_21_14_0_10_37_12]